MPNPIGRLIEDDRNSIQRNHLKGNHYISHRADDDSHDRFELFLLDEGQKKVEWREETRK